mmetsp:Transcript_46777/g.117889  ORF Transcript_46777/g.117889 Transcript_46777/m.117889 type:complete len:90 (-) Transcript_46777:1334-1603(-)
MKLLLKFREDFLGSNIFCPIKTVSNPQHGLSSWSWHVYAQEAFPRHKRMRIEGHLFNNDTAIQKKYFVQEWAGRLLAWHVNENHSSECP